ncbi:MAG: acyl-CoA dehydrogenase family protein [Myxococcales bacterium]|nr:acyl-CoA dehydrogenase family protein [Myxococcales bacterium]
MVDPVDAAEARRVAEESREQSWSGESFMRDVFLGNFRIDLLERLSLDEPNRPEFLELYRKVENFLREHVDSVKIDATGEYPPEVVRGFAELGAFGLKIPKEYGGLGLTHPEYVRVMQLIGSYDGNVTALLSAHQAIGVPQPIKLFGTEEQKKRFLPRCAKGAISAFALTEPGVGSDPARLGTTAELSEDGRHYVLNGQKLWCTNVTLADLIVVMARNPATKKINCLVVEMDWPGVKVEHRSHFMGLRALANGVVSFDNVKVPKENLIGKDGDGLKIALVTLNTGRLSLPAATSGSAKFFVEVVRKWSNARVQWGIPIGQHEAIAHKNAYILSSAFAMESIAYAVGELADQKGVDIRLEAAAAKEWNTVRNWELADETLQIRGGRGYETESSLLERGEPGIGIERAMRDSRINLIFEGSSEIMHLFIAREAVDKHLQVAGDLVDPKASIGKRLGALPKIIAFYAWWYPTRWLRWSMWPSFSRYGKLAKHLRYASRASARLARNTFHGMVRFGPGLERRQGFLFRIVDIGLEIFALATTVRHAHKLQQEGTEEAGKAVEIADFFARQTRRKIDTLFHQLWSNDDARATRVGQELLDGKHTWLERGIADLPYTAEELRPKTMDEILAEREAHRSEGAEKKPAAREELRIA